MTSLIQNAIAGTLQTVDEAAALAWLLSPVDLPLPNDSYSAYLERHGCTNFWTADDTLLLRRSGKVAPVPRPGIWPNMVRPLQLATLLRVRMELPLRLGNGYRPEPLNRQCGGAKNSRHIYNSALDIDLPATLCADKAACERLWVESARLYLEHGDRLKIGYGLYNFKWRVHLDTGWRKRIWNTLRTFPAIRKARKEMKNAR